MFIALFGGMVKSQFTITSELEVDFLLKPVKSIGTENIFKINSTPSIKHI